MTITLFGGVEMYHWRFVAVLAVLLGLVCTTYLFCCTPKVRVENSGVAEGTPKPREVHQPQSEVMATPPDEAEFLQRIRRQVGSPLENTIFNQAEVEAIADDGVATTRATPSSFAETYAEIARIQRIEPHWDGTEAFPPDNSFYNAAADGEFVYRQTLRDAARALEAAGAELEDREDYDRGDELRAWARRLRRAARASGSDATKPQ